MGFENREGRFPNRKILTIISQTPTEMVVDVRRDNTGVTKEGTPINADVFNNFQLEITAAVSTANDAKTIADNANTKSDEAVSTADGAKTESTSALTASNEAKTMANNANTTSQIAKDTANEAKELANQAKESSTEAVAKSDEAVSIADGAKTESTSALTASNEAKTMANNANTTSQDARTLASQANTNSSVAVETSDEAKTLASSANTKSDEAVSTANTAKTESTSALATSNEAKTMANTANTTSQNAKNIADEAKTLASQANTNSSTAVTTSTEAKTLASNANTKSDEAVSTANVAKTESTSAMTIANDAKSIAEGIEGQIPTKTSQLTNDSDFATTTMLEPKLESTNIIAGSNIELTKNGKNVTITALSGGVGSITMNGSTTTSPKFYAPTSGGYTGTSDAYSENELPAIGASVSGTSGKYVLVNGTATVDDTYFDDESYYWNYQYSSKTPTWKAVSSNKGYIYCNIYSNSTGTSSGTITWTGGQQYSLYPNIFIITAKQGTTGYRTFVVNCDGASSSTPYCIYGSSSSYYIKFYFSSSKTITITGANGMTITRVIQLYPNTLNTL